MNNPANSTVEVLHRPAFAMARVVLRPGESLQAESGAMVGMAGGIQLETHMQGGLLKSLARSVLGGESFFINTYHGVNQGGEVWLAPTMPGDIFTLSLANQSYLVQSGSYLGAMDGINVDTKWGGARTFFGGEGLIMLRCYGSGNLILSSYGAIQPLDLQPGQVFTVDTGHMVAFEEGVNYRVRTIGGLKTTLLGGEGLVVDLTGPGRVLLQTRSESAFLGWLIPKLPHQSSGS